MRIVDTRGHSITSLKRYVGNDVGAYVSPCRESDLDTSIVWIFGKVDTDLRTPVGRWHIYYDAATTDRTIY
jgi:hypothetical protein